MVSEDTLNLDYLKELLETGLPDETPVSEQAEAPNQPVRKKTTGKKFRKKKKNIFLRGIGAIAKLAVPIVSMVVCVTILSNMMLIFGGGATAAGSTSGVAIMDKLDMFVTNEISNALDGVLNIEKVYWLSDSDLVAPKPGAENYGTADRPEDLMWLLEEAQGLIDGQQMLFSADTPAWDGEKIHYYYDETILVITWKEKVGTAMYTVSEVKIAHPSQFRRFLANGEFGSDKQYVTTDMAKSVNAVVASSGDFYKHRYNGIVVYEGQIKRAEFKSVDTCFIDDAGNLLLSPREHFANLQEAQRFVEENNVRFSLAFGPNLVQNGESCVPDRYLLGEIDGNYSRMGLCQMDSLHYLLVNSTAEVPGQKRTDIVEFADVLVSYGVQTAYALDGGQTTVIAMDGESINRVDYGFQRQISDIIYFATALPDGE